MEIFKEKLGIEWYEALKDYLHSENFNKLGTEIAYRYKTETVYPDYVDLFRAFKLTSLEKVKVVILGQDPYPRGEADGLAFSVKVSDNTWRIPPSLQAIFDEIEQDVYGGFKVEQDWNLERWAEQGVLLLNTILTVKKNVPKSHAFIGWEEFTKQVLTVLNNNSTPICFMLWGKEAKSYEKFITNKEHFVLRAGHPATKFYETDYWSGNGHFSDCRAFIENIYKQQIEW